MEPATGEGSELRNDIPISGGRSLYDPHAIPSYPKERHGPSCLMLHRFMQPTTGAIPTFSLLHV